MLFRSQVAGLPDPVGEIIDGWVRPNGLRISRVRVPLGVVAIIYENRPNVTSDAAGLCLKSGNAAFLRGSSGAITSNLAIAAILREAYVKVDLPPDALVLVSDTTREGAIEFMQQRGSIDCLSPRGGPSLIQSILDNATVPYVIDGAGNCHVYVDAEADLEMAARSSTTPRPSGPRFAMPRRPCWFTGRWPHRSWLVWRRYSRGWSWWPMPKQWCCSPPLPRRSRATGPMSSSI